jgi:hypothetical protein
MLKLGTKSWNNWALESMVGRLGTLALIVEAIICMLAYEKWVQGP